MTIEALRTENTELWQLKGHAFTELEEALRAIHGAACTLNELACRPGESMFAFFGEHLEAQHDRAYEAFETLALLWKKTGHEE